MSEPVISEQLFEVWWAMDGCLPETEQPVFVGTFNECEAYALEDPDGYYESVSADHNLFNFYITNHEPEQEN
jgi:hypothetical protein